MFRIRIFFFEIVMISFDFSVGFLCEAKRHNRTAALFTKESAIKENVYINREFHQTLINNRSLDF